MTCSRLDLFHTGTDRHPLPGREGAGRELRLGLPAEAIAYPEGEFAQQQLPFHHNQGFSARARLVILRPVPLS